MKMEIDFDPILCEFAIYQCIGELFRNRTLRPPEQFHPRRMARRLFSGTTFVGVIPNWIPRTFWCRETKSDGSTCARRWKTWTLGTFRWPTKNLMLVLHSEKKDSETLSCGVHFGSTAGSGSCFAPKLCIISWTRFNTPILNGILSS